MPTATPVTASMKRVPGDIIGEAGMTMTSIDWMPHCMANMTPESMKRAIIAAVKMTTATCQTPPPMVMRASSPRRTPMSTPADISNILRIFFSTVKPTTT